MPLLSRREVIRAAALIGGTLGAASAYASGRGASSNASHVNRFKAHEKVPTRFEPLPFGSQRLGGLLASRMQVNMDHRLLRFREEELLVGFTKRDHGGDKEGQWLGEHAGKFLDAGCNVLRYSNNPALRQIVDRVAATLVRSQAADGYLGTYTAEDRWKSWDVWVHKYNLIGLLNYYELTGDVSSMNACRRMGDLLCRTFGEEPGMLNIVESGWYSGMAATSVLEPMCKLYRIAGERRYLEFSQYIVRAYDTPNGPRIVTELLESGSVLRIDGAKAYEMLSNFNGLIDLYLITGEERLLQAVLRAWDDIVKNQLYFTGTMSAAECFLPKGKMYSFASANVAETCVNVTWLQLNLRLLRITGEMRFSEEIERTLFNHLLGAQDGANGDFSYYTALAGQKEYSDKILCCVSSGPRGIALIPQFVWGLEPDAFAIHQYTSGEAMFSMSGTSVRISMATSFPGDGLINLIVAPESAVRFKLRVRVPSWARNFTATGGTKTWSGKPGTMLEIDREWQSETNLQIRMDLPIEVLTLGTLYPDYVAIRRGPQVLALDEALNAGAPYLHRIALKGAERIDLGASTPPASWMGQQVYEMDALVGSPAGKELRYEQRKVYLAPFADVRRFRVWFSRAERMRYDIPALTAFERAEMSENKTQAQEPETEYLTDENTATFCTADPRNPLLRKIKGHAVGERGGVVWFGVKMVKSRTISRVVFRHGATQLNGGWFDTSKGKPKVLVLPAGSDEWMELGLLDSYPVTDASSAPATLTNGKAFEFVLTLEMTVRGIRVSGNAAGDYASCSELAAYS